MKNVISVLLIAFVFTMACKDDDVSSCTTLATVKDYTGLDGCGYVFVLEDGKVLQPFFSIGYSQTIVVQNDPLSGFEFKEGKKVMINYEIITGVANTCMAGDLVSITCLTDLGTILQ